MGVATPNPSLASLPEVVANGGKIPARAVDAFAIRTVYASSIAGVVLDCDLDTGLTASGGAPTDNASKLNAVLATATATVPIHLVIDGGSSLSAPLVIPATGHVTIEGLGWDTGFFILAGSTCSGIQNFPHTNLAEYMAWNPGGAQSIAGSNVTLSNFRLVGNRTGPNCNGHTDGTLTGQTATPSDQRGPYAGVYWLSGVVLVGLDKVHVERLWIYDSPAYGINLYHCTNVSGGDNRIESPGRSTNTDAYHLNGGCANIDFDGGRLGVGDDAMAVNLAEGDGTAGGNITFSNMYLDNSLTAGRVYGQVSSGATSFVTFRAIQGTCQNRGIQVGTETGPTSTTPELNHLTRMIDWDVALTAGSLEYNSLLMISACAGVIEMTGCVFYAPTLACPMVLVDLAYSQAVGSLRISDCSIHRNDAGAAAACLLSMTAAGSEIKDLHISNFRVTEQVGGGSPYADIPALINITNGTIPRLTFGGSVTGVGTLIDIASTAIVNEVVLTNVKHASNAGSPTSTAIVSAWPTTIVFVGAYDGTNLAGLASGTILLGGPGVLASGYPVADSIMGNSSLYLGSGHSNNPCIKLAGTAHTINYT